MAEDDGSRVDFTRGAADRIAKTVITVERGSRNLSGPRMSRVWDEYSGGGMRLGKTTAAWNKGTLATITLYEKGTPPNETINDSPYTLVDCVNKFANVGSGKWVMVGLAGNGSWYLIAAEC